MQGSSLLNSHLLRIEFIGDLVCHVIVHVIVWNVEKVEVHMEEAVDRNRMGDDGENNGDNSSSSCSSDEESAVGSTLTVHYKARNHVTINRPRNLCATVVHCPVASSNTDDDNNVKPVAEVCTVLLSKVRE